MSSQNAFFSSSPVSPNARRARRSKYTWKHLHTLAHSATNCPLRVIAHIDLDAFYAQCEMVRLDVDPDQPLAVQQWQGLIAINYPARAYGLNRHVTVTEAKEKCPDIICQHVATWKEGDTKWSYSDDAFKEIATRKVSLDPYRIESRKILATIKESLPADKQKVEKASIDEVFLDLSAHVHSLLLQRYPQLDAPPPYDDPTEPLPKPPTTALDWKADALVDLDNTHNEEDDPDWDDVVMLIASEIVRDVRAQIFRKLKYTCSAGISRNKMLAKLGSGSATGGKFGDEVVAAFNTDSVSELLAVSIEQLKKQLGDGSGSWLYNVIRGEDDSEVNPRTQIKSMLSAKSFRPSINSFEVACKWLRIFVADIFGRLVEEGVLENKRRPKTINIHHRQGAQTRSKQAPIPLGKTVTEDALFDLAKNLMAQVVVDGRAWPCANLSLSVGGFEDGVTGNMGINTFLVRGDEAKAMNAANLERQDSTEYRRGGKRRRIKVGGIPTFFQHKYNSTGSDRDEDGGNATPVSDHDRAEHELDEGASHAERGHHHSSSKLPRSAQTASTEQPWPDHDHTKAYLAPPFMYQTPKPPDPSQQTSIDDYFCERCKKHMHVDQRAEHEDYHFAQDLQNEQSPPRPPPKPVPLANPASSSKPKGRGRPAGGNLGPEKGQKKLAFG
ncbi:uncharacterized protein MYCFIDRAFT_203083 [Pseudocercospora fijiensis CIRAD86]|uniref:DNA polymerase eta n=1 Tax=Pseudocercospora fijiensis (strain CIRAD86) TaxID=383855 RepID=M3B5F3_PSEFD|nr:uncharacterized protein MYCFIDRAFT_203083 [Pseudocercospora fijiensis CIRAD86]EME84592.1 hypothetical protein MYCFIDRAFT_203083 [Pseudocercospora fijiensis CIRAD86]